MNDSRIGAQYLNSDAGTNDADSLDRYTNWQERD
jgi:hypothetical protein